MDMKKIAFAALIVIATISSVVAAADHSHSHAHAPAPAPATHDAAAPAHETAHAPANNAIAALPAVWSLIGASILSFFTLYMH
ncbi:UNVERIFIED_CONTAM: hypothetical protein Sindi_1152500 [Sesamum indicum]